MMACSTGPPGTNWMIVKQRNVMPMNVGMRGDYDDRYMDEADEIRHMINERRRRRGGGMY